MSGVCCGHDPPGSRRTLHWCLGLGHTKGRCVETAEDGQEEAQTRGRRTTPEETSHESGVVPSRGDSKDPAVRPPGQTPRAVDSGAGRLSLEPGAVRRSSTGLLQRTHGTRAPRDGGSVLRDRRHQWCSGRRTGRGGVPEKENAVSANTDETRGGLGSGQDLRNPDILEPYFQGTDQEVRQTHWWVSPDVVNTCEGPCSLRPPPKPTPSKCRQGSVLRFRGKRGIPSPRVNTDDPGDSGLQQTLEV